MVILSAAGRMVITTMMCCFSGLPAPPAPSPTLALSPGILPPPGSPTPPPMVLDAGGGRVELGGMDEAALDGLAELLSEPSDAYEDDGPPEGGTVYTRLRDGGQLRLSLASRHSLWGHLVWNAARVMARHIEASDPPLVKGKRVLELGAGAGLPSLVAALEGARLVVASDYPDEPLLSALRANVEGVPGARGVVRVAGFRWGDPVGEGELMGMAGPGGFDVILMSDLVFNHVAHAKLLGSCRRLLAHGGEVLVTFSHHRRTQARGDMQFFRMAEGSGVGGWGEGFGFRVEKLGEEKMEAMNLGRGPAGRREGDEENEEGSTVVHIYRMS